MTSMIMSPPAESCSSAEITQSQAGAGDAVLFLHGSASSARMWRAAAQALPPCYRALMPDLIGYGGAAAWPADAPFDIAAEARALEPVLPGGASITSSDTPTAAWWRCGSRSPIRRGFARSS
jgi:pimeloyl-ACP methyl ester carboxylesterase